MSTDTRFEWAPQEITERLARLEEHKQHVATKADMEELRGVINNNNAELRGVINENSAKLRGFIKETVSDSEIATLKGFLRNWTIIASLAVPTVTAIVVALLNG